LNSDPQKRDNIDKMMKKLYNKRSDIVHEGETEIEKDELANMQNVVISCLLEICAKTSDWKSMKDLADWARKQRYN
jgi:hypothetical protein